MYAYELMFINSCICQQLLLQIAVYGKNFCVSAKNAFFLIMRNIVRVAVVDKVADFLLLISKLVVVGATGNIEYFTAISFIFCCG